MHGIGICYEYSAPKFQMMAAKFDECSLDVFNNDVGAR